MVKITSLKEFLPERPVMFEPPKLMYVWNGFDDVESPTLADVAYVNPSLSVNRVLAFGVNVSARNMGTTWDHCAECCTTLGEENGEHLAQETKECREASGEQSCIGAAKLTGKMVTHKELSRWLSDGNGQVMVVRKMDGITPLQWCTSFSYTIDLDDVSVPCECGVGVGEQYVKVRKYGDTKSADPTKEYLGLADSEHVERATFCNVVRWLSDGLCGMTGASITYGFDEVLIQRNRTVIRLTPTEISFARYVGSDSAIEPELYKVDCNLEGRLAYDPDVTMDDYSRVMTDRVDYLRYLAGIIGASDTGTVVDWNTYTRR